jgi:hypothetical protein
LTVPIKDDDHHRLVGRAALQFIMKTIAEPKKKKRSKTIEAFDNLELDADGNHPLLVK